MGSTPTWATVTPVLVEQPGVLATLSRWRSRVRVPPGTLERSGTQSRQSGEAQTFVTLWVRLPLRALSRRLGIGEPNRL